MNPASVWAVTALTWRIYGFSIVMFALAIIPGSNFLYSGHGGPAWLLAIFVFPVILFQLWRLYRGKGPDTSVQRQKYVWVSLASYFPLSFAAAAWGAASIKATFGLPVSAFDMWCWFIFPLSLPAAFLH